MKVGKSRSEAGMRGIEVLGRGGLADMARILGGFFIW